MASMSEIKTVDVLSSLLEEANRVAGSSTGACLISVPGNPTPKCVQLTKEQCAAVKGVYIGGSCP